MGVGQQPDSPLSHAADLRRPLLAIEFPGLGDFDDPRLQSRRLFSELFGTFLLVLVGAGGAVVSSISHGAISRTAAVTAPGLMVCLIRGPMVTCLTFSSIRITTSPPRCTIPKIGGFSLAKVPRPRSPFKRRRRPGRPFF